MFEHHTPCFKCLILRSLGSFWPVLSGIQECDDTLLLFDLN
ncbi:hypothetical protein yinte0001_26230 [Yersinia intermedia ATCC 29909]|nr:hypothetical protein yinte0001_26230 [Yersinia intermedia ATCC 29909]